MTPVADSSKVNAPGSGIAAWHRAIDLILIAAGFGIALGVYTASFQGGLTLQEMVIGTASSVLGFWIAIQLKDWGKGGADSEWIVTVEQFCFGGGLNLLLRSLMTYSFSIRRTPVLIMTGSLLSALFLAGARRWIFERQRQESRVLMVGFDSVARGLVSALKRPLIGVVDSAAPESAAGIPYLGALEKLGEIVQEFRPTHLVVADKGWRNWLSPTELLRYRFGGIEVEEVQTVYEMLFSRVCCERLQPMELLLSSTLRGDSRTMAIQAVYSNLIALGLLLALSPLMAAIALGVALFSGPGPVLESIECAGFQYIPFRMLRFRTVRYGADAGITRIGRMIRKLRLTNLPQLINIVRGEMTLVGPSPVRREFAGYLTSAMPFYSHRFSVKPGIIGWARMNAPKHIVADDCRQVEYDLYYIKEGSLWLDLEIFFRMLPGSSGSLWRKGVR